MAHTPKKLKGETVYRNQVFQTGLMSQLLDGIYDADFLPSLTEGGSQCHHREFPASPMTAHRQTRQGVS